MPELPEVEVTKRGITPALLNKKISKIYFSDKSLREPFSSDLYNLEGGYIQSIQRRGKYIILVSDKGYVLIHLGMSGHLHVTDENEPIKKHDHFEIQTSEGVIVRLNDTRRFGLVKYYSLDNPPFENSPLKELGPEPLTELFNSDYLFEKLKKYKKDIKQTIMDNKVVVGVGNIYASEVLFISRIHPEKKANTLSKEQCDVLTQNIKDVLSKAILQGGTTIRDFEGADGKLGYFVQNLMVYGHDGEKCKECGHIIEKITQGQRSTYFCPYCQKL